MKIWIKKKFNEAREKNMNSKKNSFAGRMKETIVKNLNLGMLSGYFKNMVQERLKVELALRKANLNKNSIKRTNTMESRESEDWSD